MRQFRWAFAALAGAGALGLSLVALAQDRQPLKQGPACNAISTQATCEGRNDCQWVAAVMDKDNKQRRKAFCRAKPKS
jgi:hypothetical protein